MIYDHPSAYIYVSPRPSFSSSSTLQASLRRETHIQWTPIPHVGASEGSTWSPYFKSPLPTTSRSSLSVPGRVPISSQSIFAKYVRCPPLIHIEGPKQERSSSPSSSPSSSVCFSMDEDDDRAMLGNCENRAIGLGAMVQEPASPLPSYASILVAGGMEV
ncbi:hypothetical protein BC939DRAFT_444043 [Gamsiella multidivaricata]|uniref:uncharacterized protein n=1 Tax=Gamsiella multidivaricata TaxID=101098 RepID=UPI00221F730C|nr:uncharacterized protein BC939DRAFT_444043 [Gamsiella multidivaricata]KAI7828257.1 hypothetical protein BC939DRAFT_444043 [Gamsiella multidivaricata]